MSTEQNTTRRAEEIREETGCAWEIACQRAEAERDAMQDDRVRSYDVSDVHLHTPGAPTLAIALPLLAAAPERPLWALVAMLVIIALMPVVGYLATRHARPEVQARKVACEGDAVAVLVEARAMAQERALVGLPRYQRHPKRPELERVYGTHGEPMPCRVFEVRGA